MFLSEAEVKNFRNYKSVKVTLSEGLHIFVGDNGQGKTSFLEALVVAFRGRSFRPFMENYFIKEKEKSCFIHLSLDESGRQSQIQSSFKKTEDRVEKKVLYNEKPTSFSFLEKKFCPVVFTSEKLNMIKEGGKERRNFVDEILLFSQDRVLVRLFQRALKQKKAVLFGYKKGEISLSKAEELLESLNPLFLKTTFDLICARKQLLTSLFEGLKTTVFFSENSPELQFQSELASIPLENEKELPKVLEEALQKYHKKELLAGKPLFGAHKQSIDFLFNGRNARLFCSQGQQRSYALSLLLAQIRLLQSSFLFLDDVFSELDERAQKNLVFLQEKEGLQTFITSCKKVSFKAKKTSFFLVKNGTIGLYK